MNWQSLLNDDIQKFIREHENADTASLALKKSPNTNWDYRLIINQIKSRQKAKAKIPHWLEIDNVIFPPANVMEQASSAATASYKASLIKGENFIDLTTGAGVDSSALLSHFENGICIEIDEQSASLIEHNLQYLTDTPTKVINTTAEDYIQDMPGVDLALIDPQRRDTNAKGKFKLEDCAPNILDMLPSLRSKATHIMLKTSPMLDIAQAIAQLETAQHVHVVEYQGDCKELLFILNDQPNANPTITAIKLDHAGKALKSLSFTTKEEQDTTAAIAQPSQYLFEPSPAFQKVGAFNLLAARFNLKKLHKHTHLYTSDVLCPDFPGRHFEVLGHYPYKKGALPIQKANISARNFPEKPEIIRKKLKLKDGGKDTIFACTLSDERRALLHCRSLG